MPKASPQVKPDSINEGKVMALLAYLSGLCILPLLFKRENAFVLHHGKQGLVLFVAQVGVFLLHIMLGMWILKLGIFLLGALSFIGMIAVIRGEELALPVISNLAENITL